MKRIQLNGMMALNLVECFNAWDCGSLESEGDARYKFFQLTPGLFLFNRIALGWPYTEL